MSSQQPLPVFLTPGQIGVILQIKERTLEKWRDVGFGPPYRRVGNGRREKAIYELHALGAWLEQYARPGS